MSTSLKSRLRSCHTKIWSKQGLKINISAHYTRHLASLKKIKKRWRKKNLPLLPQVTVFQSNDHCDTPNALIQMHWAHPFLELLAFHLSWRHLSWREIFGIFAEVDLPENLEILTKKRGWIWVDMAGLLWILVLEWINMNYNMNWQSERKCPKIRDPSR